ncbi:helix-turn-helix domain-containing protein [Comamonas testosteroni]|jgi:transcriptional regulator with XRE-family HTH domain|uniref:Transcriptional regulator, XRE family n=1 Tax=Comamonas testosteroni (strain DSM 14576 / KF-1) TaxID=399795 RepID=B7WQA9_COMTK|nr:helix-turn-helix domain-containing protein [Comamonas testosteroni]EED65080.1 transcriptional regulator, XRE family [Comamonas testosteroni KF-1]WQG68430.1 helix-turn-helix domain-containing protein [Comamonas testosteroni]HMS07324.1 helix-turn-helix domain-containing protein [Burkholderiaceae bacterium]
MKPDDDDFVLHRQLLLQLGDRLRRLRKDAKVSSVELAKRAGVSRTTLYAVEAGDPSPSMGNYLRVMAALGVASDLALVAGDLLRAPPADSAAGRSHRPKPQVSIIVSADNKRHQAQDLQSLVLHELAVDLVKKDPERIKEAQQVLERWMATAGPHSRPLFDKWMAILRNRQWSKVLGRNRNAQELRQSSPLTVLLPKGTREQALESVSRLKAGLVLSDMSSATHEP